jgi:hypothetical protein
MRQSAARRDDACLQQRDKSSGLRAALRNAQGAVVSIERTGTGRPLVVGSIAHLVASMQDLVRDWRRWTKAERVAAGAIAALILIGVPAALAIGV